MSALTQTNATHALPPGLPHAAALNALPPAQRALAREALAAPLSCVADALFMNLATERALFVDGPDIPAPPTGWYHPVLEALPVARTAPRSARLSRAEERHLFLRYNYARWRTRLAVDRFRAQASRAGAQALALWYGRVKSTRDVIAHANLALVLAMAKRTRGGQAEFGEMVSEGNLALLRAIDAFDVARGFKFSTYACRAIRKALFRLLDKAGRHRALFRADYDLAVLRSDDAQNRRDRAEQEAVAALQGILRGNHAGLSPVERTILQSRFALDGQPEAPALTLHEVGRIVGMTKERVRQIQNQALAKLRTALEGDAPSP